MSRGILWVEVEKTTVSIRKGGKMPAPRDSMYLMWGPRNVIDRKEFARWSGITFPEPGIYGLACDFSVVSRYRKVVEETKIAVTERKNKWVKLDA